MTNAIGIDLGTSFSCVAVFRNGTVEIIKNDYGNLTTPSYVAFTNNEYVVGDAAKNPIVSNHQNTVFGIQRLVGHKITDQIIQTAMKFWPFAVICDANDCPKILVQYNGKKTAYSPEEILGMILSYIKKNVQNHIGDTVSDVVITIPAYYNYFQRQVIRDAANMAGLNARLLPVTSAAALTYVHNQRVKNEQNVLVFDLGAETCNVSILVIEDDILEVRSVSGDNHLGGDYFTQRMINHFTAEIKRSTGRDVASNLRSFCRLRIACEEAMRTLSSETIANIQIDSLFDGVDFVSTITRTRFEEICADLFRNTLDVVNYVLRNVKLVKQKIHEIILVGGCSRIPKVQHLLSEFFDGKPLNKSLHPDEAAAYGAAIQAALFLKDKNLQDFLLLDVTPFGLGIEVDNGDFCQVVKKITTIPTKTTQTFTTSVDNQQSKIFKIYEGNRAKVKDNKFFGAIELSGICPAPAGVPQIEVTFDIDANYGITVAAKDKLTGKTVSIDFAKDRKNLLADQNDENREEINFKTQLENLCFGIKNCLENEEVQKKISHADYKKISNKCDEIFQWLNTNKDANEQECENLLNEFKDIWNAIICKLYGPPLDK